jgi:hypothetical protein
LVLGLQEHDPLIAPVSSASAEADLKRLIVQCGFNQGLIARGLGMKRRQLISLFRGDFRIGQGIDPKRALRLQRWSELWLETIVDFLSQWSREEWEDMWLGAFTSETEICLPPTEEFPEAGPLDRAPERARFGMRPAMLMEIRQGQLPGVPPRLVFRINQARETARHLINARATALTAKMANEDPLENPKIKHNWLLSFVQAGGIGPDFQIRDKQPVTVFNKSNVSLTVLSGNQIAANVNTEWRAAMEAQKSAAHPKMGDRTVGGRKALDGGAARAVGTLELGAADFRCEYAEDAEARGRQADVAVEAESAGGRGGSADQARAGRVSPF